MEQKIYLYDKEKDTTLEGCISELSTMTDEERVAYFEKLSVEERKELYSYMKWQAAAERSKRLYLEAEQEFLKEQREQLMKENDAAKDEIAQLFEAEKECLTNAFEGFKDAFGKEDFPMCGMDQHTVLYLLGELAFRTGNIDEAKKYVSNVLVARDANNRIKNKALELKERIQGNA